MIHKFGIQNLNLQSIISTRCTCQPLAEAITIGRFLNSQGISVSNQIMIASWQDQTISVSSPLMHSVNNTDGTSGNSLRAKTTNANYLGAEGLIDSMDGHSLLNFDWVWDLVRMNTRFSQFQSTGQKEFDFRGRENPW